MQTCTDRTRAGAWLKAVKLLRAQKERIYNLLVEIEEPAAVTPQSRSVESTVDAFLRAHSCQPIHTVAETIFPAAEYRTGGLAKVYDYAKTIYPGIRSLPANRHGTYALRLVQRHCSDGSTVVPLELLIEKLRRQLKQRGPQRAIYEVDLGLEPLELKFYNVETDADNVRGGQCLSHVSLKLGQKRELYLTALYRYQYFLQKALGNFKGLARLQACIAREVGIPVGPLVCHATLAALEVQDTPWGWPAIDGLIAECDATASAAECAA